MDGADDDQSRSGRLKGALMNKDQEATARRTIVNVLSREHQLMIQRRAAAAGEVAAEKARLSAWEAESKRDDWGGSGLGGGFQSQEKRVQMAEEQLKTAEHNATCSAIAMEYIALHFVDQLEKAAS